MGSRPVWLEHSDRGRKLGFKRMRDLDGDLIGLWRELGSEQGDGGHLKGSLWLLSGKKTV